MREAVPDFHLLIIGGGPDAGIAEAAAAELPWVHYVGPKLGAEKTALASLGRVFLMPGLVGLGVLDSFAYGTPMVTTDVPYHSPEIDYLRHGENGLIVADDVRTYAEAVTELLTDEAWRLQLRRGAAAASGDLHDPSNGAAVHRWGSSGTHKRPTDLDGPLLSQGSGQDARSVTT